MPCRISCGAARDRYAGKTVAVLGAGHSAIGTLAEPAHLQEQAPRTEVVWLLRGNDPVEGIRRRGQRQARRARRTRVPHSRHSSPPAVVRVEAGFAVTHVSASGERDAGRSRFGCCGRHVLVDELIVATGFRPDLTFLNELRLRLDPAIEAPVALAPLIDPNQHSCGTVRPHGARELAQDEPGLHISPA